jgi:predicted Zn-dependent protease with MMP-like domain
VAQNPPPSSPEHSDEELEAELAELLDELHELAYDNPEAALECFDALPVEVREHPEALLERGRALFVVEGAKAAVPVFVAALEKDPELSDAHHALGTTYQELGDTENARKHYLETLRLDTRDDEIYKLVNDEARDRIIQVAAETIEDLPEDYRARIQHVPVIVQDRPDRDAVAEGFDPRAYGLFEGQDHGAVLSSEGAQSVTRIVLFAANLIADFPEPEVLDEEVRVTVLHEFGHFFGLDEDDMERLELD